MVEGIRKDEGRGGDGREEGKNIEMKGMRTKKEGQKRQMKPSNKGVRTRRDNYKKSSGSKNLNVDNMCRKNGWWKTMNMKRRREKDGRYRV